MKKCFFLALSLLLLWSATSPVNATTIVLPTDDQLIGKSPLIAVGRVLTSRPVERNGGIWTETIFEVDEVLKGSARGKKLVIREVGGVLGDRRHVIFGSPRYMEGEVALVFLTPTIRGDYQTMDLFVGKFEGRSAPGGVRIWSRPASAEGTLLLDGRFVPIVTMNELQRDQESFREYIRAKVRGDSRLPSYRIKIAQLPESDFSLIDEPNIYRWFVFDGGGTAAWQSIGSQPGYTGGGVNEMKTAMATWTTYTAANIRYSYFGNVLTSKGGGLTRPNGINEVLFNDPLEEVAGSWNPGSGGVVGVGGFNSASSGPTWSSKFAADGAHPAQTYFTTANILEGNLVIQNGVTPGTGMSSYTLAEIIAHEFGHTLGFGHSSSNSALMYYAITGGGPTLKPDDQTAARWLYPAGGPTPPPPPPPPPTPTVPSSPSNLSAVAVGSNRVQLSWIDNASNETAQRVYVAAGSASFSLVGEVAANHTSATLQNLSPGTTYRFQLTAYNSAGESATSNVAQLTMSSEVLQANFALSPATGVADHTTFTFTDLSTGPVSSRSWSFGDGSTSSATNPSHLYTRAGGYSVTLTVRSSAGGESSFSRNVTVTLPTTPLAAAFSFTPPSPSIIDTIAFVDESSGLVTSWNWSFGDGTGSGAQNPTKRYTMPGTYTVTLIVSGSSGSATVTRSLFVAGGSGGSPAVVADFDWSITSPSTEQSITFRDRSSGTPSSWSWSFGDGTSSSLEAPAHRFTRSGRFDVTLTASNGGSTSSRTKSITIREPLPYFQSVIPVAADTTGQAGSSWRTELSLFNPGTSLVDVELRFIPQTGGTAARKSLQLAAGRGVVFANALRDLFSTADGAGAILVEATNPVESATLKVTSRTFTSAASGTYGQLVPDVTESVPTRTWLPAMVSNAEYRTNVGLLNRSSSAVNVSLVLFRADGSTLATNSINLPGETFQQTALAALFPEVAGGSFTDLSVQILAAVPDAVYAYSSVVDNRTQDPVYIPAAVQPGGNELVIPAVARVPGAGGTFWRTDLSLFNPASVSMTLNVSLLATGADNRGVASKTLTLPSGRTTTIADIVSWLGSESGSGALVLGWSGTSGGPIITSRTYTERLSDRGSFGQFIGAEPRSRFGSSSIVTGLRSDLDFRTNIGLVNLGGEEAKVTLSLVASDGRQVAVTDMSIPPRSQLQFALPSLFDGIDAATIGSFTLRATSTGSDLLSYGSVVDNSSGDPIFLPGE